jgi:hypothetical protein
MDVLPLVPVTVSMAMCNSQCPLFFTFVWSALLGWDRLYIVPNHWWIKKGKRIGIVSLIKVLVNWPPWKQEITVLGIGLRFEFYFTLGVLDMEKSQIQLSKLLFVFSVSMLLRLETGFIRCMLYYSLVILDWSWLCVSYEVLSKTI